MKKKKVTGLNLRKHVITPLQADKVGGGEQASTILTPPIVASALFCTRWNGCDLPTIGSGDGSNCISTDGKSLCGGR